jgi:hypothetical protein
VRKLTLLPSARRPAGILVPTQVRAALPTDEDTQHRRAGPDGANRKAGIVSRRRLRAPRPTAWSARGLLFAALCLVVSSAAADWTTAIPVSGTAAAEDQAFFFRAFPPLRQHAARDGTTLVMLGPRLVRYSTDGAFLGSGSAPLDGSRIDAFEHLERAPDGQLYAWSDSQGMAALEPSGAVRWTTPRGARLSSAPLFAADGSISYVDVHFPGENRHELHLRRLLPDGTSVLDRDLRMAEGLGFGSLDAVYDLMLGRLPGSEDFIVAGNMGFEYAIMARFTARGDVRWYWKGPGRLLRYGDASSFAPLADGSVLVAAQAPVKSDWEIWHLAPDGTELSRGAFPSLPDYPGVRTFISGQGRVYQFNAAADGSAVIVGRDRTGRELWRVPRSASCVSYCNIFPASNGDLWISGYGRSGYRIERYSPEGQLRFAHDAADVVPGVTAGTVLGELDDERMLLALRRAETAPGGSTPSRRGDEWVAIGLDGSARLRAPLPAWRNALLPAPAVALDDEGNTLLVVSALDDSRDRLERVDAAGRTLGSIELESRDALGRPLKAGLCGAALCVMHERGVKAYAQAGSGAVAWKTPAGEPTDAMYVFSNGRLLLQRYRFHPDASDVLIPQLQLHDIDGAALPLPPTLAEGAFVYGFDPRLGAMIKSGDADSRLRGDGTLVPWSDPRGIPGLSDAPAGEQLELVRYHVLPGGDTIVIASFRRSLDVFSLTQARTLRLARVKADGSVAWRRDWAEAGRATDIGILNPSLSTSSSGDLLMCTRHAASGAIWLTAIRSLDGEILTRRVVGCPAARCEAADFKPGPDGSVLGFGRGSVSTRAEHQVVRVDGLFAGERLPAQAALSGVWFAPESSGQGVTVQHAADGSLGLAWFTHARAAEPDVGFLRWYTMSGNFAAGQTELSLPVYAVQGGVFDAPPAVGASVVGQARLWLGSCDRLELRVRFDDAYTVGGTDLRRGGEVALTLQRVVPATQPCLAGTGAQPASRSADPRVTGVWYEPETAGQGIFLYRVEATAAQPAVIAGAWFAHDPAGTGQAAAESAHWFTLSGDGLRADGSYALSIGQTLGGHLGGVATRNSTPVGVATLTPGDCNELTLEYRFDDREVARAFRALEGRLALERVLGGCSSESGASRR